MKISKFCLFSLLIILSISGSVLLYSSERSNIIPRELLFGNPKKASPKLSPDGSQLAFLQPDENNVLNVYVQKIGSKEAKKVTQDAYRGIRGFMWQYDSGHIIYNQDKAGDENWHLFQVDLKTKETRDLTPYDGVSASLQAYEPDFPEKLLISMNARDPKLMDVYAVDLETGALTLDTENPGAVISWITDNNLRIRACQAYDKDGALVTSVRDTVETPWREVLRFDPLEAGGEVVSFSPDERALYILSSKDADKVRLLEFDLASQTSRLIAEDPQYDIGSVLLHPTKNYIQAIGIERDRYTLAALDPEIEADFEALSEKLGASFEVTSSDILDKNWVVASTSDVRPTHYYLYDRETKNPEFLFSTKPALEEYKLSPMAPISFAARDGMQLFGYLTLPVNQPAKKLPTVLMVHGGPWSRDTWGFLPSVQWLANRGYAVLQINFRGSTGYGKAYCNAGDREWGAKMHTDLLDGKEWLIQQGITDTERVAIYGGSYGGYATLAALAFTPDEFCCGVDIVGPSNLVTLLETLPPYWKPLQVRMDRRVGNLEKDRALLEERSPLFKADQIKKPLLIMQGANDPRVKQAESDQIVEAMRRNIQPVEYLLFPDEGHGFARPENRLKSYAAAEAFLEKYMAPQQ